MKKYFTTIIFILASILLLLIDWIKGQLVLLTANSLGAELVFGLLMYIPYILYCGLVIWAVIYLLKRIKEIRWRAFVPFIIVMITLLILFCVPYSKGYLNFDYEINKTNRLKTIEMVSNKEIQLYHTDEEEFIAPYRSTSYNRKIYVQDVDGVTKVRFYSYIGFNKSRIIVYTSDDSGISEYDFNYGISEKKLNLSDVTKLDKNWYSAITTPVSRNSLDSNSLSSKFNYMQKGIKCIMGIIILVLTLLVIHRVIEVNLKLRQRYQQFSAKFERYYIDFVVFIILLAVTFAIVVLLDFLGVSEGVNIYVLGALFIYSVYIILPFDNNSER